MRLYYFLLTIVFQLALPLSNTSYAMPSSSAVSQPTLKNKKSKNIERDHHHLKKPKKKWLTNWVVKRTTKKAQKKMNRADYDSRETDYYAKASAISFGLGLILLALLNFLSLFGFFLSMVFSIVSIIRILRKPEQRKGLLLAIIPLGLIVGGILFIAISLRFCC